MGKSDLERQGKRFYRELTVAHIREPKGEDYLEVVFLESARFYKLLKQNPTYNEIVRLLQDAMAKRRVLKVRCASPDSDIIEGV